MDLIGKIAWVTGSTGKIGELTANKLRDRGATVITHGTKKIDKPNHVCGDLTQEAVKSIVHDIGNIDILVCCAGGNRRLEGTGPPPMDDCLNINMDEFFGQFHKNLMTMIYCCREIVPGMIQRNWGRVVTVGSCIVGLPRKGAQTATYAISKAAVHEYTIQLANQVRNHNITVNCVAPSSTKSTETKTNTMTRYARPEEIASVISFLCGTDASYVSGEIIRVNGGNTRNQSFMNNEESL